MIYALEHQGFETWLVGGCVRDAALGKHSFTDYDLSTQALPEAVVDIALEQGFFCSRTASRFGTIFAIKQDISLEITTMRTESAYICARRPSSVQFCTSIHTDLARRDFTLNSMAWHPQRGIFDPFEGLKDIQNALIRTSQSPAHCFKEDALRILRALRFLALTNFRLESITKEALCNAAHTLTKLSFDRIRNELSKLLVLPYASETLDSSKEIFALIIPELAPSFTFDQKSPYHAYSVWEHTLKVVQLSPKDTVVRWAALFHDLGKPFCFSQDSTGRGHFYGHEKRSAQIAYKYLHLFNFPKHEATRISALVRYHDADLGSSWSNLVEFMLATKTNLSFLQDLLALKFADELGKGTHPSSRLHSLKEAELQILEALLHSKPSSLRDLAITGDNLLDLGFNEGPQIRDALEELLLCVSQETVLNETNALLNFEKFKISCK